MEGKCKIVRPRDVLPFQPRLGQACDNYVHTDNDAKVAYSFKTDKQGNCVRGDKWDLRGGPARCPDQDEALERIRLFSQNNGGGGKRKRKSRRNKGKTHRKKSRHAKKRKSMRRARTRKNKSRRSRRRR